MARHSTILLLLIPAVIGCAGTSQLPASYQGVPDYEMTQTPDVQARVQEAYSLLDVAFEAARQHDTRAGQQHLADAASVLVAALQSNPHSRDAAVALGVIYFYQGYYGHREGFERCVDHLSQVLDVDPDAVQAARYLATAYSHLGDASQVIYYANYAESLADDPSLRREMAALRRPYQKDFLNNWYAYENYYESKSAVVKELNPEKLRLDVVLQITPEFEKNLAAKGMQELTSSVRYAEDSETKSYLQRLVDNLAARTKGPPFTYGVDIIEAPEVNAVALPGQILVNTGLLRFVENEAELVAILSHELAHIYAHHSARQLVADYQNRKLASTLLDLSPIQDRRYAQLLDLGARATLELIERGYSRRQEKEADRFGTHIAYNAGYNPTFMTSFFLRLYEANPKQPFRLLATHPPTDDRIEYTARYLENFPLDVELQLDSEDFQAMKQRLK